MHEAAGKDARAAQKDLVRFVRYVITHAPARLEPGDAGIMVVLGGKDPHGGKQPRPVAAATIDQARSLGLVTVEGDIIRPTA